MNDELIGIGDPEWHELLTKQQIMRRLLNQFRWHRLNIADDKEFRDRLTNLYIDLELDYRQIAWLINHLPETARQARKYLDYQEIKRSLTSIVQAHVSSLEKIIAVIKP